jgi:hypothetical protein
VRKSAKEWNIQQAESSLLQNLYYESQTTQLTKDADESLQLQSIAVLPRKYIPRKMLR